MNNNLLSLISPFNILTPKTRPFTKLTLSTFPTGRGVKWRYQLNESEKYSHQFVFRIPLKVCDVFEGLAGERSFMDGWSLALKNFALLGRGVCD